MNRNPFSVLRIVIICLSLIFVGIAATIFSARAVEPSIRHDGRAGLYVRVGKSIDELSNSSPKIKQGKEGKKHKKRKKQEDATEMIQNHPLVDAVVLEVPWSHIELQKGVYHFDSVIQEVNRWGKAGKGVVLNFPLYGQSVNDPQTPAWIYEQPGVRAISFHGGGTAKGQMIRIPAVWDKGFAEQYVDPRVEALAKVLDGNPNIWYIMPGLGHIGNLNAQPSKEGAPALLHAGWTPEKWSDYTRRTIEIYQKHFLRTPLVIKSSGVLIGKSRTNPYQSEAAALHTELGKRGVALIHFGLEAEKEPMLKVYKNIEGFIPYARQGITRLGLGDDWPLWVPESRRKKGPTQGYDEDNLKKILDYAFGGIDGLPETPTTILFCQEPEILASYPDAPDYRPQVAEVLKKARERLKENERAISSIKSSRGKP